MAAYNLAKNNRLSPAERNLVAIRRVFGHALEWPPHELYEAAGFPTSSDMPEDVTAVIAEDARDRGFDNVDGASVLLRTGLADTQSALWQSLIIRTVEQGVNFAVHPDTTHSIAILALRNPDHLADITRVGLKGVSTHVIAQDGNSFMTRLSPSPAREGCPFAGTNGTVDIDPLFRRFVPWAAQLSIAGLTAHHKHSTE